MAHVKKIRDLIDNCQVEEAHRALENLLELGPCNVEALKLQAFLYENEGRFKEAAKIWYKIFEIDEEDYDVLEFLERKQIEDKEHYYFTDEVPGGGRRYFAYPKSLIKISMLGLLGCIVFLIFIRSGHPGGYLQHPAAITTVFFLLVILPWISIIHTYISSIYSLTITSWGIEVATRFKTFSFEWNGLEKICLSHSLDPNNPNLKLVLLPRDINARPIEIDMNESTSPIRARTYLANEINMFCSRISYEPYTSIDFSNKEILSF